MVRGGGSRHTSSSHSRSFNSFRSRSYSYNTGSSRSFGGRTDDCDCHYGESSTCSSCCTCCVDFGPMLIFNVFVLILFLVPIISSFIAVSIDMDPGETRILNYGGSAFVHEISLLTADNDVDVYFLRKPVLSHAPNKASYRNRENLSLGPEEYVNFQHWLNKGSSIDLTYSAERGAIHMYILKSEATWRKWKETFNDGSHYSTYWSSTDIYRYSSSRAAQHVRYNVKEDDLYVIVFVNENWRRGRSCTSTIACSRQIMLCHRQLSQFVVQTQLCKMRMWTRKGGARYLYTRMNRTSSSLLHQMYLYLKMILSQLLPCPKAPMISQQSGFSPSATPACTELDICWAWC